MYLSQKLRISRRSVRDALKRLYLAVPLKKEVFTAIRTVWVPPEPILHKLYFDGTFRVEVEGGAPFDVQHTHDYIETSIFWKGLTGGWEATSLSTWIRLARSANTIMDIGANTGIYALAAKAVNPRAEVFAFEPMPRVYAKLIHNNEMNGSRIHCENLAASNRDGNAVMYDLPHSSHTYGGTVNKNLYPGNMEVQPIVVRTTRLDSFIQQQYSGVDLVKIDVESHEPEVLAGLGDELPRSRPTILVEIWNDVIGEAVERTVADHDYLYFATDDQAPFVQRPSIRQPPQGRPFTNFLLCPKERAASVLSP
jgi:FkbM family methyltransferase